MSFLGDPRNGFGVSVRVAGYAPILVLVLAIAEMVAFAAFSDPRSSVAPWLFDGIAAPVGLTLIMLAWIVVGQSLLRLPYVGPQRSNGNT